MKQIKKKSKMSRGYKSFIFFMLLPSLVFILIFTYYPLLKSIPMAFQKYTLQNINNIKFIGFDNFRTLFSREPGNMFYTTIGNTVKWVIVSLVTQLGLGFIIAMVLQQGFFGKKIYQALIFFPWAVSGFIIGIMWRWMFNGTAGVINDMLIKVGILNAPYGFLSEVGSALNSVIVANIWYGVPFFTIMITAALKTVPADLYEAASVDGANAFQSFKVVTFPHIKPVIFLTVLLRVIWIFNFPDLIYSMTGGNPAGSSHIITSYMMEKIKGLDYGMGSAVGMIVILFLSIYTIFYLWITKTNKSND